MKGLAVWVVVAALLSLFAGADVEAAPRKKKRKAVPAQKAPSKGAEPSAPEGKERSEAVESPPSKRAPARATEESSRSKEKVSATSAEAGWKTTLGIGGGGFLAGGANRGPQAGAQVTVRPPSFPARLSLEASVDWRLATFRADVPSFGALDSALHQVPITIGARFEVYRLQRFAVDVRAGAGPMISVHALTSDFAAPVTRTSVGWEAFGAAQLRYELAPVELFLDARFGLGEASMPFLLGRASGAQGLLGVRFSL